MILVVGSGIAGLWAAHRLATLGKEVTLLTRGALTDSNTWFAQGGVAAAMDQEDSPFEHFQDTLNAGAGLCDPVHVEILVREGPARIRELIELGFPFDRDGDQLALGLEGAHRRRRVLHAGGDATGRRMEDFLAAQVRQQVRVLERCPVDGLLVAGNQVVGVSAGDEAMLADAVILATGGACALYPFSTNPPGALGEGIALAYQAGAVLSDLEFVQFHPTCLRMEGVPPFLISEAVRGEGAILRDTAGEAFMERYHPMRDLAPRDQVSRAIRTELLQSQEPNVWLDTAAVENFSTRFPTIDAYLTKHGIGRLIPVAPAAHYFMGGIRTDSHGRTNLPGLLAVGEAATTGIHGANRLASNSLLEGLVFAQRAAEAACEVRPLRRSGTPCRLEPTSPETLGQIRAILDRHVGLVRERAGLSRAIDELASLKGSLAELAGLIAWSALRREESRGAHFRLDYPQASSAFEGRLNVERDVACKTFTLSSLTQS